MYDLDCGTIIAQLFLHYLDVAVGLSEMQGYTRGRGAERPI